MDCYTVTPYFCICLLIFDMKNGECKYSCSRNTGTKFIFLSLEWVIIHISLIRCTREFESTLKAKEKHLKEIHIRIRKHLLFYK
jgi:hypothetical protein